MNREDIIRMGAESKISLYSLGKEKEKFINYLERFAALVASAEREACVKAIEDQIGWDMDDPESTAIKAIRAKGQA
jgi:hypothetical protein